MTRTLFGTLDDGTPIHEVALRSPGGAEAKVMEWGAVLRDLVVPLPGGGRQRVVLGFPSLADYPAYSSYFGAIAGRYANRIGGGRFVLDGVAYQAPLNEKGRHSLHGGLSFGKRPWTLAHHDEASVTLALVSPDGDAGYPGTLRLWCRYSLVGTATLRLELSATTDAATVINLAHHSYFRLDDSPDILDHELELRANLMTPVDAELIPDGSVASVAGTPFDFRKARPIRCANPDGTRFWYDHNYLLRRDRREPAHLAGLELAHAATLRSHRSGLAMAIWTTEPALQVYDGAKLNTPVPGLDGVPYGPNAGIALEPQHAPDSPNLPHFPSTVLRPGEVYRQVSEFRFGA